MKKNFFYALMSAIALTSAVGFTACSSDSDAVVENNPTITGERVKTQFTISFPQNVASTRMGADQVQATPTIAKFRGMDYIKLIPFGINEEIAATNTRIGSPIALATQIKGSSEETKNVSNFIAPTDLTATSNSVLYQDVQIPVGTGAFLFYGKAIDNAQNTPITTIGDKFKFGTLTPSDELSSANNTAPTDITFTPVAIQETVAGKKDGDAQKIANYLTAIAKTAGWSTETNPALAQLYTRFISMKAGSSTAVADLLGDLLWSLRNNTSDLANAIRASIYHGHTPDATTGAIACENGLISKAIEGTGTYVVTLGDNCADYPENNNLPEGAAQITWDGTSGEFVVTSTNIPTATSTNMNVAALQNYVYPANLQYYVNSRAMVSETSQKDKYNGTNDWTTIIGNYNAGYVSVPTRSVAIEKPIQYGVGQLRMRAKTAGITLKDNSDQLETVPEADVTVPVDGITIKGILIGGQRAVDWEFLPSSSSSLYTIYDNAIPAGCVVSNNGFQENFNYTLALETPVREKVYVALELVNNTGVTFYGNNNEKILPNRTFYLVGEIDPTNPATTTTKTYVRDHKTYWPTGAPATKAAGDQIDQVFVQDYVTTLNLTIKDLRKALNTIPDLRMPNMEFGLSVDLTWNEGLFFNIDL